MDTAASGNRNSTNECVSDKVTLSGNACAYFRNNLGKKCYSSLATTGKEKKYAAADASYQYEAYVNTANSILSAVNYKEIADYLTIPEVGKSRLTDTIFDSSLGSVYIKRDDKKLAEPGKAKSDFEEYEENTCYALIAEMVPKFGYKFTTDFTVSKMNSYRTAKPDATSVSDATASKTTAVVEYDYSYFKPAIKTQPKAFVCAENRTDVETLTVEVENGENMKYFWHVVLCCGVSSESSSASGEAFLYSGDYQTNKLRINLAKVLPETETTCQGDLTLAEIDEIYFYCTVTSPAGVAVNSQKTYLGLDHKYGDYFGDGSVHRQKCLDEKCGFAADGSAHEDTNSDHVCDICKAKLCYITKQPVNTVYNSDGVATFTVEASGTNMTYEWHIVSKSGEDKKIVGPVGGSKFNGCNTKTLEVTGASFVASQEYSFYCLVRSDTSNVKSGSAKVGKPTPVNITKQPESVTCEKKDGKTKLSVTSSGEQLKYEWYIVKDGTEYLISESNPKFSGQRTGELTVIYSKFAGSCDNVCKDKYKCLVTGAGGYAWTDEVTVTVLHSPKTGKYESDKDGHWATCFCGEAIKKEAHKEGAEWYTDAVATTKAAGSRHTECTVCGRAIQTAVIPQLKEECKHSKTTTVGAVAPTATKPGSTGKTVCTVCGATVREATEIPVISGDFTKGDVDDNKVIDVKDARFALRAAIKLTDEGLDFSKPANREFKAADVDGNGTIDVKDARSILRVAIKLDKSF